MIYMAKHGKNMWSLHDNDEDPFVAYTAAIALLYSTKITQKSKKHVYIERN